MKFLPKLGTIFSKGLGKVAAIQHDAVSKDEDVLIGGAEGQEEQAEPVLQNVKDKSTPPGLLRSLSKQSVFAGNVQDRKAGGFLRSISSRNLDLTRTGEDTVKGAKNANVDQQSNSSRPELLRGLSRRLVFARDANGKKTEESQPSTSNATASVSQSVQEPERKKKRGVFANISKHISKPFKAKHTETNGTAPVKSHFGGLGKALAAKKNQFTENMKHVGDKVNKTGLGSKLQGISKTVGISNISKLGEKVTNYAKDKLYKHNDLYEAKKAEARALSIDQEVKDMQFIAHATARAGLMRGEYYLQKTITCRMEELRLAREREEAERARLAAELRKKQLLCRGIAENLWAGVYKHALTEGVVLVIKKRAHDEFIRLRGLRVRDRFEKLFVKHKTRLRSTRCAKLVIRNSILVGFLSEVHKRQNCAPVIQRAFRVMAAKRELLFLYILHEAKLAMMGRQEVLKLWRGRLKRAYQSIAPVETEQHRRIRRLLWARKVFSKMIQDKHHVQLRKVKIVGPPCIDAYNQPCSGNVALKLPNLKASEIVAPLGEENSEYRSVLKWVGVPVGVAERANASGKKPHFKMVYQPLPTRMLNITLNDSRDRARAETTLEKLRAQADQYEKDVAKKRSEFLANRSRTVSNKNQEHDNGSADLLVQSNVEVEKKTDEWYENERREVWCNTQSILF